MFELAQKKGEPVNVCFATRANENQTQTKDEITIRQIYRSQSSCEKPAAQPLSSMYHNQDCIFFCDEAAFSLVLGGRHAHEVGWTPSVIVKFTKAEQNNLKIIVRLLKDKHVQGSAANGWLSSIRDSFYSIRSSISHVGIGSVQDWTVNGHLLARSTHAPPCFKLEPGFGKGVHAIKSNPKLIFTTVENIYDSRKYHQNLTTGQRGLLWEWT